MYWQTLRKSPSSSHAAPNLVNYQRECHTFSWDAARALLDGLPGGRGLNIAHEAVDRHALGARADHDALRFVAADGARRSITYAELARETDRFANVLRGLGVGKGDRVFLLLPRVPTVYVASMGALKNGNVVCTLFSAFGPDPIRERMRIGGAKVLVTTSTLYQKKVAPIRDQLPELTLVLLLGDDVEGTVDLELAMQQASTDFTIAPTDPEDPALLHFTSGTTGRPKGAVHVHAAVLHHHMSARYALDLQPDDVFWCTADPGWVTGTSYGIIAPLTHGVTSVVHEGDFDAETWYRILEAERVTVWYTAPTAVRMMMKAGAAVARKYAVPALRFIASVGEPLNPEGVVWGLEAFGLPIHDNWWQTETGGIMIANYQACEIRPGSMGRPLPGIEAAIVRRTADGGVERVPVGAEGELAIRAPWPSMFRAYLGDDARYRACFVGEWYLSGDLAQVDADGFFWFVGRGDDVIKTAGHLVGPFEVESTLMEHPGVAEAAVIGKPDPVAMTIIKAFVALKPGFDADDSLRRELLALTRKRLGAAIAPREIDFLPTLPKTRSGKIMRRLLKARELGLPEGDTSTLEPG